MESPACPRRRSETTRAGIVLGSWGPSVETGHQRVGVQLCEREIEREVTVYVIRRLSMN